MSGFASGFANQLPQAEMAWQKVLAGRQQLQAAARQQQANEAFFKSLISPDAAAVPQQGPPGMQMQPPQMPMQQPPGPPQAPPGGGAPGMPGMAGPQPGPSAMPPGRPPMMAAAPAPPPPRPQQQPSPGAGFQAPAQPAAAPSFDPTMRLRAMAQAIKRANPGLDNQTLSIALDKQIETMRGLAPDDRIIMQMELAQQKFQSTRDVAELRADLERMKETGRDNRAGNVEAGKNDRFHTAQASAQAGGIGDDDARVLAEAWVAGDRTVTQGLGWGKTGAANRAKVLGSATKIITDRGGSGEELAAAKAEFMGTQAGSRAVGTQAARIGIASRELQKFIPPLLAASKAVDRTQFPTFNALQIAAERGTGGEAVVRLVSQVNAVKNAYAQIAARGGQSTDDARHRADEVMNAAWSNGQIEAGAKQLMIEADSALSAAEEAKGDVTAKLRSGKKPAAPGGAGDGWSIEEVK